MIYHFTGNSEYLLSNQVKLWKNYFMEKHSDLGFSRVKNLNDVDFNFINQTLTSQTLFDPKKLIIIDLEIGGKDTKLLEKQEYILSLLGNIPNDNILVLCTVNPDKRSKIYKGINAVAEIKEYNTKDSDDIKSILQNKYGNHLSHEALNLIIQYKGGNINKIISELDKLLITRTHITKEDIIAYIMPELEESIFFLIDDLLNIRITESLNKMDIILANTNIYAFYNNLIANLRTSIFIADLKYKKISVSEIGNILNLGNRAFLTTKHYKISFHTLKKFYIGLVDIDKKMKSGYIIGTDDNGFKLELEKCIINLK